MSIYQDANGGWIYFDGETKHRVASQQEAISMVEKTGYVQAFQGAATTLAQVASQFTTFHGAYFDREYNSGGGDQIQDSDIESTGMTAAEVGELITLAEQLYNFLNNMAVIQGDYKAILNKARTDLG